MDDCSRDKSYLVAGCKTWNRDIFESIISSYPGEWRFISNKKELDLATVKEIEPRYIFFLHWSWIVPSELVNNYECVCFHMTDLPYGRGGSPLQNLIMRGHTKTMLTAFRMVEYLDSGPIYMKEPLSLAGSAGDIYRRASKLSARMIEKMICDEPKPTKQQGEVVEFKRRCPAESLIPEVKSCEALYDFIRMLDADGYPRAFLIHEGSKYEFSDSIILDGKVLAGVTITPFNKDPL